MNRLWIAFSLIIVAISLCITENLLINKVTDNLTNYLEINMNELKNNNYQNLYYSNDILINKWNKYEKILSMFMQHDSLTDLEESIKILKPNIEFEDYNQLSIEMEKAKFYVENLKHSQAASIHNIL